jgi:hypothetical protein
MSGYRYSKTHLLDESNCFAKRVHRIDVNIVVILILIIFSKSTSADGATVLTGTRGDGLDEVLRRKVERMFHAPEFMLEQKG